MTPSTSISKADLLLAKLAKLIAAQTAGSASGFTTEELNHAYMSLTKGEVCEDTAALLVKMLGADWAEGWEPSATDEELESEATNIAVSETLWLAGSWAGWRPPERPTTSGFIPRAWRTTVKMMELSNI